MQEKYHEWKKNIVREKKKANTQMDWISSEILTQAKKNQNGFKQNAI